MEVCVQRSGPFFYIFPIFRHEKVSFDRNTTRLDYYYYCWLIVLLNLSLAGILDQSDLSSSLLGLSLVFFFLLLLFLVVAVVVDLIGFYLPARTL